MMKSELLRCPCYRHRESAAGLQFGVSLLGVGVAATAYHASSGKLRKHLRKLDYWSISLSTTAAVRAALPAKSQASSMLNGLCSMLTLDAHSQCAQCSPLMCSMLTIKYSCHELLKAHDWHYQLRCCASNCFACSTCCAVCSANVNSIPLAAHNTDC